MRFSGSNGNPAAFLITAPTVTTGVPPKRHIACVCYCRHPARALGATLLSLLYGSHPSPLFSLLAPLSTWLAGPSSRTNFRVCEKGVE
ncbi:hypothetical protein GQ54DRAFT_298531 [Martensiomyces pterosporus]|nr:hypothetical protein GQ54DRAFT_298531 [Martensiomyces pterosporus]